MRNKRATSAPASVASRSQIVIYSVVGFGCSCPMRWKRHDQGSEHVRTSCLGASERRRRMINLMRLEPRLLRVPVAGN
jgi:hypothetical protein